MRSLLGSPRYEQVGKRDLRLDLLRGYALFVMAINHARILSYWHLITGNGRFFINAAEGFFFVSGMTLGIITRGKPIGPTLRAQLRRTAKVYAYAVGLVLFFSLLNLLLTGLDNFLLGDLARIGLRIVTLQRSCCYSPVLNTYVVFFIGSIPALYALLRGRTWIVVAVVVGIYIFSQTNPLIATLPFAPFALFRNIAANNLVFYGGLVIGFHRKEISDWWEARPYTRVGDILMVAIALALLIIFVTKPTFVPRSIALMSFHLTKIRSTRMPPLHLALVFLYLRVFWLLVTHLWQPLKAATGWLLLPLGQNSLLTFVLHVAAIRVLHITPGVRRDLPRSAATLWNIYYMAMIYGAVHLRGWLLARWKGRRIVATDPALSGG